MRILLAIVVLIGLGWSGFWFWNASLRERALTGWLEERRAAGWVADGAVRVTGFPNRVDTIVTGLELANPKAGWSWGAPEFQILSQTWRPQQVIAVWPDSQSIATPFDTLQVTSDRLVGSLLLEPNPRLGLDHSTLEARGLGLTGTAGWHATLGEALFSIRKAQAETRPFSYDVDFNGKDLALPENWLTGINRGAVPRAIDSAHVAGVASFDRAWDRPAIENDNPALQRLAISEAHFIWGKLDLTAKGTLDVDADGLAEGELKLTAQNWQAMLDAADQAGMIAPGVAGTLRGALGLLAGLSGGDRGSLSLPLTFRDGQTRLGPVPVGPAPRLARRA